MAQEYSDEYSRGTLRACPFWLLTKEAAPRASCSTAALQRFAPRCNISCLQGGRGRRHFECVSTQSPIREYAAYPRAYPRALQRRVIQGGEGGEARDRRVAHRRPGLAPPPCAALASPRVTAPVSTHSTPCRSFLVSTQSTPCEYPEYPCKYLTRAPQASCATRSSQGELTQGALGTAGVP